MQKVPENVFSYSCYVKQCSVSKKMFEKQLISNYNNYFVHTYMFAFVQLVSVIVAFVEATT